jgi:imidazolonepropionase-like amidohydrolase
VTLNRAVAIGALASSLFAAVAPRAQSSAPALAFVDVTVVPMDGERVVPGQTVIVRGARIEQWGPSGAVSIPHGATRIEARGKFLMPGLAEMHAHVPGGNATDDAIERVLTLYVANGITTARSMLGHPRHLALRDRIARGEVIAPRIYTSGPSFNGNSAPTAEAAVKMVTDQKAAGFDFLKIHPGITRGVFEALATAAQGAGLRFAGHVPLDLGLERALELKFATIDHLDGYLEAMVRSDAPVKAAASQWFGSNLLAYVDESRIPALVAATRRAGTWNVPTESLLTHSVSEEAPEAMARWPEMKYVAPAQRAQWIENKTKFMASGTTTPATRARFVEVRRRLIKALHAGGAGLLLGSDAPQVWNVPGFSIHRELRMLVEAGLTPYQAIETGTRSVATFFGTSAGAGTVTAGKRADLLLVDGNPLADIGNTSRIWGVVVAGRWLDRATLDAKLKGLEY